jgi:hypothetical protein
VKRRRQSLAHESGQIQSLTAFRDVREQYLDKWMLSVGRWASLVFPAHDSLKRGKVQLAKRVILITEQALSSSAVLDGLRPDVKYLAAYERLDLFSSIPGKEPMTDHDDCQQAFIATSSLMPKLSRGKADNRLAIQSS